MNLPAKKTKYLSQALLVSGLLNMAVLGFLVYWIKKERPPTPYCELKPVDLKSKPALVDTRSVSEIFKELHALRFRELVERLERTQLVEDGYAERDFALAFLVAFHDFDLARALQPDGAPSQKRTIAWHPPKQKEAAVLTIYPNMQDEQYRGVMQFARTESYPYTPEGLFKRLKLQKGEGLIDASLAETFYLTSEFWATELLFKRLYHPIKQERLLQVILEIGWEPFKQFASEQKRRNDLSETRRRTFLMECIKNGSETAVVLLLENYFDFALKKVDDTAALQILTLLKQRTKESDEYARQLLSSPRSLAVLKLAAQRLYDFAGESMPKNWDHPGTLARFIPGRQPVVVSEAKKPAVQAALPQKKTSEAVACQETVYKVQEGDTLWKISRKYKTDVEAIKQANHLSSNAIKPGIALKIPN
ncbi:MAG: LysM peptidoglycan-binding domain-containing protein [Parachlamydia sp.]|jgi:hypothetical protein|nr:LysM peptidoglycan-binding domain-containing protein [Parachlamydia sp.]